MSEVITPIIKVDVGESQQTVKGLKKEITDLKDRILNLTKGSEEYNAAVEELQDNQRRLNEVMALTKKEAVAVEGSYDALVHKMSQLKKEWRATADEAKRAEIGEEIGKINAQLKELDAEIGNYQRNVGNYVSHWEGMPEVTRDFGTAMREMNESIEPTKQSFEAVSNIASGLASGFAAVQGAAALLGEENENLEKTFIKLQAAMAIAQGVGGLKGLVEGAGKAKVAFGQLTQSVTAAGGGIKGLMKIMGKSGWIAVILAVAAALTLLFKNLPMVKKQEAAWEAQIRSTIEAQEQLKASIEKSNEKLEDRIELLKAQGVEERKLIEIQLEQAKTNKKTAWDNLMKAQNKYIDVKSDAQGVMEMTNGAFKQKYGMNKEDALEHYKKLQDEATDFYHQQEDIYNSLLHQLEVLDAQDKTSFGKRLERYEDELKTKRQLLKEQYEEDLALAEKYGYDKTVIVQKYLKDLAALKDTEVDLLAQAQEDIMAQLDADVAAMDGDIVIDGATSTGYQYKDGDAEKRYGYWNNIIDDETSNAIRRSKLDGGTPEEQDALLIKGEERKLAKLKEFWEMARKEGDVTGELALRQQIAEQELTIEEEKNRAILESEERTKEKRMKIMNEISNALSAAGSVTQGILEITQAAAEKDGKISEKESKRIKGMQYATATINMLQGAVSAFSAAQSIPPPFGQIIGAANAAAVIAMGTANLMKIKNTDLTGSVPSGAMGAVTPNSNVFGTDVPFSYTQNVTGQSEIDALNQDTKVYILESDLQTSNKKVQMRENESSF